MFEAVAAGLATAVAASTLIGAYTGLVQKFDKLETGQRALESEQQDIKSELKDVKAGQRALELGFQEIRGDLTIVGCISVGGFAFVLLVMRQPPAL